MLFVNTHRLPIIHNQTKRFQQKIYEHHLTGTNNHHQPSLLPPTLLQHQLIIKTNQLSQQEELYSSGVGMGDFTSSQELNELNQEDDYDVGIRIVDEDVSAISGIGGGDGNDNSDNDDELWEHDVYLFCT
jgi:hypothetical protein